jgi:hypothetical protein
MILSATSVYAEEAEAGWAIFGLGARDCGEVLDALEGAGNKGKQGIHEMIINYGMGFLSGLAVAEYAKTGEFLKYRRVDSEAFYNHLMSYCSKSPRDAGVFPAFYELSAEIETKK